ncbi:MAG: 3-deoxy-D-manno-octulosonic acid transferase [Mariprofundaceae bacterium]|nr:3-deoxy-D-manno-octulosonic acid transferase [Mariprofundaceae bacterium]
MLSSHASPSWRKWSQHFLLNQPQAQKDGVWVHACSLGEVASIVPLIQHLHAQGHPIHLTVITRTGFEHALKQVGDIATISYLPWDLPTLMRRFVQCLKPKLLLLTETEFWPGMLKACANQGVKVVGINTRISDRSFPKYYATRFFWRRWLAYVDMFLPQSDVDAERLIAMGVDASNVQVVGNLKYAVTVPKVNVQNLRQRVDASETRPIVLVASTHDDEEQRILKMWQVWHRQQPDMLLVIVPRHPERFDVVESMIANQGVSVVRWSQEANTQGADVLLVDAIGVLQSLYTIADIAIIGGSLVPVGGHNPLEAAVCGRGVITGPYIQNFREIMRNMQKNNAAMVVNDDEELESLVNTLLREPEQLRRLHAHAALLMQKNTQVLERVCHVVESLL